MCVCCFHLLFPPQHRHALIQIKHAHTNQYHVLLLLQYKLRIYDTSIPVCTHNERPFFPQSPFLCDHAVSHRLLTMPKPHSIYLLLLIIVTTPPFFISQAHAQPDPYHVAIERRVPRACRPDDARCLALQRDVCDPWNITASDKCTFVQVDQYCREDVNRINYLALFYCHNKVLMAISGICWLLLLFFIMTVTAEVFLCPSIEYLSWRMGMAPDIAGVTLFAFASGAPDLFTQVAALASGNHVDIELAVSATFGGGLFIICVVFAVVILASTNNVNNNGSSRYGVGGGGEDGQLVLQVPDRRAYTRDTTAYLAATIGMTVLLWFGSLTTLTGVVLVLGYVVYLCVCLWTRGTGSDVNGGDGGGGGRHHSRARTSNGIGKGAAGDGDEEEGEDAELEMVPFTLEVVEDPGSPPDHASPFSNTYRSSGTATNNTNKAEGSMSPKKSGPSPEPPPRIDPRIRSRTYAMGSGGTNSAEHQPLSPVLEEITPLPQLQQQEQQQYNASSRGINILEGITSWMKSVPGTIEETLHLQGPPPVTGWRRVTAYLTSPLVLAMHATMPAIHTHTGGFSMAYALLLAVVSPLFFLTAAWLGPGEVGGGVFLTIWVSSTCVMATFAFAVHPVYGYGGTGGTDPMGPSTSTALLLGLTPPDAVVVGRPHQSTTTTTSSSFLYVPTSPRVPPGTATGQANGSNGSTLGMLGPRSLGHSHQQYQHSANYGTTTSPFFQGLRPRRCVFFALIAFVQSILWLNATAEEVVSVFEAIGRIWNVRRDTLGATVLAWGETVPDLVAVLSLSRAGQGTMAIAACFGGPVFNLLVSMGGPILIAGAKSGTIPYQLTSGVVVLVVATVLVLVGLLMAVPLRYGWSLPRELGGVLLVVYAVSQVVFLMAEGIVLAQ